MSLNVQNARLAAALEQLDELTDWERRPRGSMRVDFDPILDLAHRLGNPHHSFRSVHVAGTKGKGSTCSLIASGLLRAGISVGRYASPHLVHISERISLNGEPVDEERLAYALFAAVRVFRDARHEGTRGQDATWFDLLTASAFLIFQQDRVEWAVVETGLGGRLDSTNEEIATNGSTDRLLERMQTRTELYELIDLPGYEALDATIIASELPSIPASTAP